MTPVSGSSTGFPESVGDGRYKLERVIGQGGMAKVVLARDTVTGQPCAVKLLVPPYSMVRMMRARFVREARVMRRLEHPHIVRVYDQGEWTGGAYIVMEYLPRGSLADRLDRDGPMPPSEAAHAMAAVLDALSVAHQHGVIHRDIKPPNLLVGEGGAIEVTDFGIAREPDATRDLTREGAVIGTHGYIAPEHLEGRQSDARSDLYAAGATLLALATCSRPQRLYSPEERDQALAPLPEALQEVIRRATELDPADRYQSAEAMRVDLERLATDSALMRVPALPRPAPPPGSTSAPVASHSTAIPANSTIALPTPAPAPRTWLLLAIPAVAIALYAAVALRGDPAPAEGSADLPVPEAGSTDRTDTPYGIDMTETDGTPQPVVEDGEGPGGEDGEGTVASDGEEGGIVEEPEPLTKKKKGTKVVPTAPAPPPPAEPVLFNVSLWPAGDVALRGQTAEASPWKHELMPGEYVFTLQDHQGRTHDLTVQVGPGLPATACWDFERQSECER